MSWLMPPTGGIERSDRPHDDVIRTRIAGGDNWLTAMHQQWAMPLTKLARKTGISLDDLLSMTLDQIAPDDQQISQIAEAFSADPELIATFAKKTI